MRPQQPEVASILHHYCCFSGEVNNTRVEFLNSVHLFFPVNRPKILCVHVLQSDRTLYYSVMCDGVIKVGEM